MKYFKRNECPHPKKQTAKYFEHSSSTYYEKCCKCGKTLIVRKFPKAVNK